MKTFLLSGVLLLFFGRTSLLAAREFDITSRFRLSPMAWAAVRRRFWTHPDLFTSPSSTHTRKSDSWLLQLFSEALCYAA